MGLTVYYGYLAHVPEDPEGVRWFDDQLAAVNITLRNAGLPEHVEPAEVPAHTYRCGVGSIAWSWLHCLRRVHALVLQNGKAPGWRSDRAPEWYPGRDLDPIIDDELFVYIRSQAPRCTPGGQSRQLRNQPRCTEWLIGPN